MTYDVPAKLFAFHLILLSCFLLAPNVPRLVRFLLLGQTTSLPTEAQLFRGVRANRIALAAQIVTGLWLVGCPATSPGVSGYLGRGQTALAALWHLGGEADVDRRTTTPAAAHRLYPLAARHLRVTPTAWPFSAWTIRSFLMSPPSISRRELLPSGRRATRTGGQASNFSGLPGTRLSWMAGWTIIRFIWSFS